MSMDVLEAIRTKRSTREFRPDPVPDEIVRTVLEAGRWAQSSKNEQPWQFIVIRERETLRQLGECGRFAGHLAGAAFAVALVAPQTHGAGMVSFDLGQAAAYMQLAAWDADVGSCLAAMWEPDRAKDILGIPQEYDFDIAISFGYPAQTDQRVTGVQLGRRPLDDIVHQERW
jgi:nitroreductase